MRHSIWQYLVIAELLAFLPATGCEKFTIDPWPQDGDGVDINLRIVSGNLQAGTVGTVLPEELAVQATYQNGSPAEGRTVRFTVISGENEGVGSAGLSERNVFTDLDGRATCSVRLNHLPGMVRVQADTIDGAARPVIFNLSGYPEPTENKKPICFLSVNDFHSHLEPWGYPDDLQGGFARLAWTIKTIRENNTRAGIATVVVNTGDDSENTTYYDVPGYLSWTIAGWDRMGVDVWQVGNHDYHFGIPLLTERVTAAVGEFSNGTKGHPMEVLFGNVDPDGLRSDLSSYADLFETDFSDTSGEKLYQQTTLIQAGDIKVGVLGVVTDKGVYTQVAGDPAFMKMMGAANPDAEGLEFFDPNPQNSDYIARGIDSLVAGGADVLVVSSHAGLGFGDRVNLPPGYDDLIAQYGAGATTGRAIDLLLSGHSHVQLNRPIYVDNPAGGRTPIVQAREGGLFIARVDGLADIENGGLEVVDSRLIQVNSDLEEDPEVKAEAESWHESAVAQRGDGFSQKLADCPAFLSHRAETISGLGNLLNDAFFKALELDGTPVDTSIVIPSLYRTDLWPAAVTAENAYEVMSMHKMDDQGTNPDTVVYLTLRPGTLDASTLFVPGTWQRDTTSVEYLLEVIYTLPELLDLVPPIADELSIDVVQIAGVSYEVDLTAPMFHHIIPGSVLVDGAPVDPDRTYRMAVVQTFAATMAPAINMLFVGYTREDGYVSLIMEDEETGEAYTDTQIPVYQAFQDYLEGLTATTIGRDEITVTGDVVRTVQPDLTINPTEMSVDNPERGKTATFTLRVRNIGLESVASARVRLLVDLTPWDVTDQDDGRSELEGLPQDFLGSLTVVGEQTITLAGYPATQDLTFRWDVPEKLPRGYYTMHARVDDMEGNWIDPNTGELYTDWYPDNDSGEQVMAYFKVR